MPEILVNILLFFVAHQPKSDLGRLVLKFLDYTQLDTHAYRHPVWLPWTSDKPVTETATYAAHNKDKRRKVVFWAGFDSAIPAIERLQTDTPYADRYTLCRPIHFMQTDTPYADWYTLCRPIHFMQTDTLYAGRYTLCRPIHLMPHGHRGWQSYCTLSNK